MTGVTDLAEGWRLRGFLGDDWQLHRAQLHARQARDDDDRWVPAQVPGSVLADLLAAGQVPDPYVGRQSLLSEWVPQRTWVYRTRLRTPALTAGQRAFLEFDGIDYAAAIYLAGQRIAAHRGTFVPLVVEVTDRLRVGGEYSLAVVVDPAPVSEPQVGHTEAVRVHKGRMGYGWDFCPRMVHQGLWAPVRLRTTGSVRLADVWVRSQIAGESGRLTVTVDADGEITPDTRVVCAVRDPDGAVAGTAAVPLAGSTTEIGITVAAPRRWRPNGWGPAERYTVSTTLHDAAGPSDTREVRVGFRDIRFHRDPDAPATALPYRLVVDGRPGVIKGWNWVPADALYGTVDAARLRHLVGLAADAGVTMLRVWGGGLLESETFYELCDEFGILVWQEFAQSSSGMSSVPSTDPEFVAGMVAEADRIVRARRNHPSLAIWCGGNELQRRDGVPLTDADSAVLAALHEVVARLDPDRHWLPTSPSGPVFGNTLDSVRTEAEQHDVHGPWEHQGLDDHYRLHNAGRSLLASEFGVEGMTNLRAVESVVPEPDRVLPTNGSVVWDHLGRWWNNEPLVRQAFGAGITDLATLSRASQFLQADGLRYAVEANRRRPESCGTLPWQLNESFPNGWCTSAVDYFGEPKAAYHYVRRAYRPLHVTAALPAQRVTGPECLATVWAWCDTADGPATITARLLHLNGREITVARWETELAAGQPAAVGTLRCAADALAGRVSIVDLSVRMADRLATNRYLITGGADFRDLLTLPPAKMSVALETGGDTWTVRLRHTAGPAVPFLRLLDGRPATEPGWLTWDDNAIDVLPGEERVLRGRWHGVPPDRRRVLLDAWNLPARTLTEVG